jgi:hypothetical protein
MRVWGRHAAAAGARAPTTTLADPAVVDEIRKRAEAQPQED